MSPEVEAVRAELLARGVVALDDEETKKGDKFLCVAAPRYEHAQAVVAAVLGDEWEVHWVGPTPREIVPRELVDWSDRGMGGMKLGIVLYAEEHIDEVLLAEDDHKVVVRAFVCSPAQPADGQVRAEVAKVYASREIGDRLVLDGLTGVILPDVTIRLDD